MGNVTFTSKASTFLVGLRELFGNNLGNFDIRCYSGIIREKFGNNQNNLGIIENNTGIRIITSCTCNAVRSSYKQQHSVATYNVNSVFLTWS